MNLYRKYLTSLIPVRVAGDSHRTVAHCLLLQMASLVTTPELREYRFLGTTSSVGRVASVSRDWKP